MKTRGQIPLSNEENKEKMSLEAIKEVQEALRTNAVSSILVSIKKARNNLDSLISSLRLKQIAIEEAERKAEQEAKIEAKKKEEGAKKAKEEPEISMAEALKTSKQQAGSKQQANKTQTRVFDNKPNVRFNPAGGPRPFDKSKPQGANQKPYGAKPQSAGQKPFGAKPKMETYDASAIIKKDNKATTKKKTFEKTDDKKSMNKKALVMRGYVEDESLADEDYVASGKRKGKKAKETERVVAPKIDHAVITTDNLTVKLLAEKTGRSVAEIMGKFLLLGNIVNINSNIDFESAELICQELGVTLEKKHELTFEEQMAQKHKETQENESDLTKRPPVITVMGHVDHGKTSLLDYIRKTSVTAGEAGGITQHIGAYTINVNGEMITFIDTPGHAAFTAMRKRGANLTDIAILVVAADDGVMPQTIEAIKHIKEAKVPMIVAINKIDVPMANVDKIKQQLTEYDVVPEEWGGDAIMIPISAKTGQNIDKLLEMILFVSEYQNLRANPKADASGTIVEAKLDKGMGSVATVLVQNGTLKVGDYVIAGTCSGKVRAMINDKGANIKEAGPSVPVSILGLTGVPNAGDSLYAVDEKLSKQVVAERIEKERMGLIKKADLSVDSLMDKITESNFKDYNVIIKGDVSGTVEALKETLSTIANEEVKVRCIHGGVGAINENDVMLAQASNAVIIGFNVKPDFKAKILADKYKTEIKFYKIIYEAIEFVTEAIEKLKTPKYQEVVSGHAEVRQLFKASKVGVIAGSHMLDGKLTKNSKIRVLRKDKVVFDGAINSLRREKDEVKEVSAGFDFGVTLEGFIDIQVGDTLEAYTLERV